LSLAVACCRWPVTDASKQTLRHLAQEVQDWERFDLILQRNRISLLAHRALTEAGVAVPGALGQELARRALAAARKALAMARESILLQEAFERAGLPVVSLKGVSLAVLAYGDLGRKESLDVDLLTTPESVAKAAAVLVERGYTDSLAHLEPAQLDAYLQLIKESAFTHPISGMMVDLHWSVTNNRRLLQGIDAQSPTQDVATPAGALRTLARDELFAYLCLHGAVHNWSRLKWLADLGALIAAYDEAELKRLRDKAHGYGARRAASVALLLCHRLFARPLSEEFLKVLRKDPMNRFLERNVLEGLAYRAGTREHLPYTAPWFRALMAQFVLSGGPIHALEHARLMWISPIDRRETPLPRSLEFLYPVIRLPLWLARRGKSVMRRAHG
jgi:hypothetical protein